jgi:integrase
MKARVVHEVPLSPAAIAVLEQVRPLLGSADDGYVFPGHRRGSPISRMSMPMLMRRMEMGRFTVHGFRSTFRDWAGDCTNFARELIEAALAHMIENKAERAYRRSTAFEKRERLMAAWPATVIDRRPAPTDRWPPRTLQNRCVPST